MTQRRIAIWFGIIALSIIGLTAALSAQSLPTPACTTHYILLGRTEDRVLVELTVPSDGVCVLDVRKQAARRRQPA